MNLEYAAIGRNVPDRNVHRNHVQSGESSLAACLLVARRRDCRSQLAVLIPGFLQLLYLGSGNKGRRVSAWRSYSFTQ
jgi:hypothetical protein